MKILHINEYYAGLGGTENYLISLIEHLEKRGHKNAVVYRVKTEKNIHNPIVKDYYLPRNGSIRRCLDELNQILMSEKPDIVYLHNVYDHYIVEEATKKYPTVRYVHDHMLYCRGAYKLLWRSEAQCDKKFGAACVINAYLNRCSSRNPISVCKSMKSIHSQLRANKKVNRMIVASSYMKNNLEINGFSNIEILPYFIELNARPENKNTQENKSVLFIGRVSIEKGLKYLLLAFSRLPGQYKLIVAGDGPELAKNKKLAIKLKIDKQIEFAGWVPKEKIYQYYQRADLLVFPSVWPEPFGCAGPEAMSFNKPVVAFDVGGVADWLTEGKTGFLVKPKDVSQLADKIRYVAENTDAAEESRNNGHVLIKEKYSAEKHVERLLKICYQAIAEYQESK